MFEILTTVITDIAHSVSDVFTSGDWTALGALVAVGVLGAVLTSRIGGAFSAAVWALPVYALVNYVREALTMSGADTYGRSRWVEALDSGWYSISSMQGLELIGLYFAFAIVIVALFAIKAAVFARG